MIELTEQELKQIQKSVNMFANKYKYIPDYSSEDISQELYFQLYSNILPSFKGEGKLMHFINSCFRRKMMNLIMLSNQNNKKILWNSQSINYENNKGIEQELEFKATIDSPFEKLELADKIKEVLKGLSKLEKQVIVNFIRGLSYEEIGEVLNIKNKSIDNALSRFKRKYNAPNYKINK